MTQKTFHIVVFYTLLSLSLSAQKRYSLSIFEVCDSNNTALSKSYFNTSFERDKELRKYVDSYINKGHIALSIDNLSDDSLQMNVYINKGPVYKWVELRPGTTMDDFLLKSGFKEGRFNNRRFNLKSLKRLKDNCLVYCENNGYPFAEIKLDSVEIENHKVKAVLSCDKRNRIVFDSLDMAGNAQVNKSLILSYCGIKKGSPYDESAVKAIDRKMNNLPFLRLKQPASVVFQENSYVLKMVAARRDASNFDGILGIAPDNITGKVIITGDIKLKLINAFKAAEQIDLNWKHLDKIRKNLLLATANPTFFQPLLVATINSTSCRKIPPISRSETRGR